MADHSSTNQFETIIPSKMWCRESCELTGVIATTFTHFDEGILKYYLRRASFNYAKYTKNIFLFECNPDFDKEKRGLLIFNRLIRPSKQICEKGCDECIKGGNGKKLLKYFHPKLWLLRFAEKNDENKIYYRFIISSRNFAKESTKLVDGYVYVDTIIDKTKEATKCPLLPFVSGRNYSSGTKEADYLNLIDELRYITMDEPDKNNEFRLYWNDSLLPELQKADEIWLTSPFINRAFLEKILENNKMVHVYAPFNEAGYLKKEIDGEKWESRVDIHSIMPEEDVNSEGLSSKWHAKQYILKFNDKYKFVTGSHNATFNAMTNNTELSAMYTISNSDKDNILKNWNEYFPNTNIDPVVRPEAKASEMFAQTSKDPKPEELVNPDALGNMLENIEREDIRKEAIKILNKTMIGKATEDIDKEIMIVEEDLLKPDSIKAKISEPESTIKELEGKYSRLNEDQIWNNYKSDIVLLARKLSEY